MKNHVYELKLLYAKSLVSLPLVLKVFAFCVDIEASGHERGLKEKSY